MEAQPEQPDPEQPNPKQPNQEQHNQELPNPEKPNQEEPNPEEPNPEEPNPEEPNPEQPNPIQPNPEEPVPDGPSFANLPMEIILKIFPYLNFYDIQAASRTCLRWLDASESNEFQSKVLLKFCKPSLDDTTMPGQLFAKTLRAYHSLLLDETVFGSLEQFFETLSKTVEKLILISADLTDRQFFGLVNRLPNVTDLTIENCSSLFMIGQFLSTEEQQNLIRDFLYRIKKISLRKNQYLSDALLLRITTLINGIEKLDLCGCHIAYHNAIQRRFYPPNIEHIPNESILTFKFLLKVIEQHASTINELDLSHTLIGGIALSQLSSTVGLNLRKVKFNFCRQINFNGLDAFANYQKNIIELNISHSDGITDSCIQLITDNLILLQKFYLRRCRKLTNLSLLSLSRLTKLKVLDISLCDGISTDGNLDGIAKNTTNPNLEELYIVAIDVCEECIIQIARNLKKLRVLDIGHCVNGVTDHSVQEIIKNLRLLRSLDMEGCTLLTDAGLTGQNLTPRRSPSTFSPPSSSLYGFYVPPKTIPPPMLASLMSPPARSRIVSQQKPALASSSRALPIPILAAAAVSASKNINSNKGEDKIVKKKPTTKKENPPGVSIQELKGLQSLNLQCCKITDISLEDSLKFVELRRLILANCNQITDIGIRHLVINSPAIDELDLTDCNIFDQSIQNISEKLKRMRILTVSGCKKLTNVSIELIVGNCTNLQSLAINRCDNINVDSDALMGALTTLRNLSYR